VLRDRAKFGHLMAFAQALPRLRRRVRRDLLAPGLTRDKVLATIVLLLETTLIRIGNPRYARQNPHYGLTTLQNQHVDLRGALHSVGSTEVNHYLRQITGGAFSAKDFRTWAATVFCAVELIDGMAESKTRPSSPS
jgi:DNA topoisomerase-1